MQNRRLSHKDLMLGLRRYRSAVDGAADQEKGFGRRTQRREIGDRRNGTDWFARVRLGIHPGHEIEDTAQYVLAPFERALKEDLDEMLTYAAEAIESIIAEGAIKAMTKFNRRARGLKDEEE